VCRVRVAADGTRSIAQGLGCRKLSCPVRCWAIRGALSARPPSSGDDGLHPALDAWQQVHSSHPLVPIADLLLRRPIVGRRWTPPSPPRKAATPQVTQARADCGSPFAGTPSSGDDGLHPALHAWQQVHSSHPLVLIAALLLRRPIVGRRWTPPVPRRMAAASQATHARADCSSPFAGTPSSGDDGVHPALHTRQQLHRSHTLVPTAALPS
jgi:hypothetical protein